MRIDLKYPLLLIWWIIWISHAFDHLNSTHGMTIFTSIKEMKPDDSFEVKTIFLSNKGHIQKEFIPDKEYKWCQNTPKFEDDISTSSRLFYFSHEDNEVEHNDLEVYVTMKPYGTTGDRIPIFVNPNVISLDGKTPIKIHYEWKQIPQEYSHAIVDIEISNGLSYQYLKECNSVQSSFWTHLLQFLTLAKLAMTVLLVGSKMEKLKILSRIDEYEFDYTTISFKNILLLMIISSTLLVSAYIMIVYDWFLAILTLCLSTIAFIMWLFLFPDLMDWIFGIENNQEFEGSGHFLYQSWFGESLNVISTISLFLTLLLMISWWTSKNWLLSNLLAIWVSCALVKIIRFNSLYPAFIILISFFWFDIFWVIVGPMLFGGNNIIEEVLHAIIFPLKIVVPGYNAFSPWATLSIFDIVIPTFYISFLSRFGEQQHTSAYYVSHSIMYALSMGITTWAMVYSESKQPVLIYIIPFLLLTTWIVSGIRGEWKTKLSLDLSLEELDSDRGHSEIGLQFQDKEANPPIRGADRFDLKQQQEFKNAQEFQKFEDETEGQH